MSYILDALNKSEQERQNKQSPSINSQYRVPVKSKKASRYWTIFLTILVLVNFAGIVFWFTKIDESETQSIQKIETADAVSVQKETESPQFLKIESAPTKTSLRKVFISDLPIQVKDQLPDLNFSAHLYGEDKSFRMVNINGKMLKEGEDFNDDILLREITADGVVIQYQDYLIEIGILSNWRAN
ncbi:MAG: general secretion pathway protein B [Candidatus Azotimanducaceae bacterium]|jgi:general secretion pathway protein B